MAYLARIDDGVKTGGDNWPGSTEDDVDGVDKWQGHQCRKHEVSAEALGETHDGEEASWTRQKRASDVRSDKGAWGSRRDGPGETQWTGEKRPPREVRETRVEEEVLSDIPADERPLYPKS